jgi:uncharacterized protein involved in exopolysaccharide biosynthesis
MPQHRQLSLTPADVIAYLTAHPRRWLVPTAVVVAIAIVYSIVRPTTWEASQALTVRDEAAAGERPGKFHFIEDMKTVQETILELSKSHSVLLAALKQVGPVGGGDAASWPSDADVVALAGCVKLSPPRGAEFGKTEVFYLQVQDHDRSRAIALAAAVGDQLKQRYADLRDSKAQSTVDELTKTVTLSQADLKSASDRLAALDAEVGADLGELRTLTDVASGDSPLRRSITEMETELRTARAADEGNHELLDLLEQSTHDTKPLLAAPSRLLESQPALRRLKDNLVDAQLRTAQLMGNMSAVHPLVISAKTSEREITEQLRTEVEAAIGIVNSELHLSAERCARLDGQLASAKERLSKLAAIRTDYANLADEVRRRNDTLKAAETQLAEARASQASAHTASLISRIDAPDTGASPIGPSRSAIVVGGAFGGLLFGLAFVMLTIEPTKPVEPATRAAADSWMLKSAAVIRPVVEEPVVALSVAGDERNYDRKSPKTTGGLSFTEALWKVTAEGGPKR